MADMATRSPAPAILVFFGDAARIKEHALNRALDALLPPSVDRTLALTIWSGDDEPDKGGPTIAAVLEDLMTLPFLADRRVVVVRSADKFISAHRERLERYAAAPSRSGLLLLECRTFPKTTKLFKAIEGAGGRIEEFRSPTGAALVAFARAHASQLGKRVGDEALARLIDRLGPDAGLIEAELEKLALYAADRDEIMTDDVTALVGLSREEKVFAVADRAGVGDLPGALRLWRATLATDADAPYRALGGIAFVVRKWVAASAMKAQGMPTAAIAPKVMMWGRDRELQAVLDRLPPRRARRLLAALADLDAQVKGGARSIEAGVDELLARTAAPADA